MRTQLTNADIAELLALESDETAPPAQRDEPPGERFYGKVFLTV
jgi:hypothetical protein